MGRKDKKAKRPVVGDRPFLHVQLRVFAHATEDPDKARKTLFELSGFRAEDADERARFDAATSEMRSQGHFHNPIVILETELRRSRDVRRFWERIFAAPGLRSRLGEEVDERLDDDLVFWLRFDKQAACQGEVLLKAGEDVVQVRAKLATYPKDRAVGLAFLRSFLMDGATPASG